MRMEGLGAAEVARRSGIGSRQLIHKYINAERFPVPSNLLRLRRLTGGLVTADDFVDHYLETHPQEIDIP